MALVLLAGCSLPRGAALQSEVIKAADAEDAPFAVYPVTRNSVDDYAKWPRSFRFNGWVGSTRGPVSPVISAGDRIDLIVWDSSENSLLSSPGQKVVEMVNIQVSPDGTVFIPYLEKVYITGQTPDGARAMIQKRISEILPAAQVQLAYTAGQQSSVSLVGGVTTAGSYPLPNRNFTVLNLISQGGGVSSAMRNPIVRLIRDGRSYQTSLSRLYADGSQDTILRGGDKVVVEQDDRYFQALGATGQENLIYFSKDRINALEAVSLVGGISDTRADPKGVLILREYAAGQVRKDGKAGPTRTDVVFTIDLTNADGLFSARRFAIEPQDVVLVTESPVTKLQTVFNLIGGALGLATRVQSVTN